MCNGLGTALVGSLLFLSCCWCPVPTSPVPTVSVPTSPVPSWFHGKISGVEAVQELQPAEDGLFLVRESIRHPGDYVLCVSFGKEVMHYRVVHEENMLSIDSQQHFYNLIDMIEVRAPPQVSELHWGAPGPVQPAQHMVMENLWSDP